MTVFSQWKCRQSDSLLIEMCFHLQVSAGACRDHVPSQQRDVRHSALHRVQEVRLHVLQKVDHQPEDHGHHRLGPPDGTRLRQEVRQKLHSGLHRRLFDRLMALRDKFFLSGFGWNDLLTLSLVSNSLTVGASNKAIFQFNVTSKYLNG